MCGTSRPGVDGSVGRPVAVAASSLIANEDEVDRELLRALSEMSHCGHCLGVVGTNCSCGLQCAKGPAAKCVGNPVADALRRHEQERVAAIERDRAAALEIERQNQERAAEEQRILESKVSSCNSCNAKLMPGCYGTCNQCNKLGCPRLHSTGGPQGALVQEQFMQQQMAHSARTHANWAAQGIMQHSDASLSNAAASLAFGGGWGSAVSSGSGGGSIISNGHGGGGGGGNGGVAFRGGPMDTATFRRRMEAAGSPLLSGQDVCHIIAKSKGGADHSDNFFVAGASYNRSTGNRFDHIIAYIAGLPKTERAVAVSRQTGYVGPSASELVQSGKDQLASFRR